MPKTTTKKTNKSSLIKWVRAKPLPAFLLSLVLLGVLWIPASYVVGKYTDHQHKTQLYSKLSAIQNWFNPPGELVYNKLEDNGCGRDTSSWLGIYKACSYTLRKLYKGSGDATPNLKVALAQIASNGWKDADISWEVGEGGGIASQIASRNGGGRTFGFSDTTKPSIDIEYLFNDDPRDLTETPQQFFGIDQDIALNSDEYIYGIRVVGMYRG